MTWWSGSCLSTDDIMARTEYALAGRFARIRTLEQIAPAATVAG
jgi:hypothetical protein